MIRQTLQDAQFALIVATVVIVPMVAIQNVLSFILSN